MKMKTRLVNAENQNRQQQMIFLLTMVFSVSRLLGESEIWLLSSLSVCTVSGLELMIPSVSANSVLNFYHLNCMN